MAIDSLDEVLNAVLRLPEPDRLKLIQRALESIQRGGNETVRFQELRGLRKGIWGCADDIDRYIRNERGTWDH